MLQSLVIALTSPVSRWMISKECLTIVTAISFLPLLRPCIMRELVRRSTIGHQVTQVTTSSTPSQTNAHTYTHAHTHTYTQYLCFSESLGCIPPGCVRQKHGTLLLNCDVVLHTTGTGQHSDSHPQLPTHTHYHGNYTLPFSTLNLHHQARDQYDWLPTHAIQTPLTAKLMSLTWTSSILHFPNSLTSTLGTSTGAASKSSAISENYTTQAAAADRLELDTEDTHTHSPYVQANYTTL